MNYFNGTREDPGAYKEALRWTLAPTRGHTPSPPEINSGQASQEGIADSVLKLNFNIPLLRGVQGCVTLAPQASYRTKNLINRALNVMVI